MNTAVRVLLRILVFTVVLAVVLVAGGSGFGQIEVLLAVLLAAAVSFGPVLVNHWRPKAATRP